MMTRIPVAGVVWQTVHYLLGFERLGYEAYYVETHARTPSMLMEREEDDSSARWRPRSSTRVMRRFGLGDRWAFYGLHDDDRCFGHERARSSSGCTARPQLLINLHGGTEPLPGARTRRTGSSTSRPTRCSCRSSSTTDLQATLDFLEPHCAFFTFAENYGSSGLRLPVARPLPAPPHAPAGGDATSGAAARARAGERSRRSATGGSPGAR